MAYDISVLEFIGLSITSVLYLDRELNKELKRIYWGINYKCLVSRQRVKQRVKENLLGYQLKVFGI